MIFWMYNAYSAQNDYRDFVGTESRYIPSKYTVLSRLFDRVSIWKKYFRCDN